MIMLFFRHSLILLSAAIVTAIDDPLCPLTGETSKTLNIHLVPHTHNDVGWLKTVDQYYYGLNNTIQQAHVSLILDNVFHQLLDTSKHNRTFTYVEMAFFSKWYLSLSPSQQSSLKGLVKNNQFSFANGGWCMHDEATTHFMGMIDQTTLGHDFLRKELGVTPTAGWQIDPFGHSATQGGIMTSGMGFDAVYFGRMHYVELENRQKDGECEGLWESTVGGEKDTVFWGLSGSFNGNYGAPEGFCFDVLCDDDPLVGLDENALRKRIEKFLLLMKEQSRRTKGANIMVTMGMDFQFSQARKNFQNMDLLIDATSHFLKNGAIDVKEIFGDNFDNVQVFYSTPARYTQCKYVDLVNARQSKNSMSLDSIDIVQETRRLSSDSWQPKLGDFFPYADCDHCYWTGYFSSRQALKRLERVGSSFLHAARQIQSIRELQGAVVGPIKRELNSDSEGSELIPKLRLWNESPLYKLDDAMGVAQHHDAVSGTSKQHVANDYAKRISSGICSAAAFVTQAIRELLLNEDALNQGLLEDLSYCHLLNETVCEVSQTASFDDTKSLYAFVYNGLSFTRSDIVSLPISNNDQGYIVQRLVEIPNEWAQVNSVLLPNSNYANIAGSAPAVLHFEADELPSGLSIFRIEKSQSHSGADAKLLVNTNPRLRASQEDIVISNGILSVHCDSASGVIKRIVQDSSGVQVDVEQSYGYYEAFFHPETPIGSASFNVKGNGICLPGYIDVEGDEMPWLKGSAVTWQNSGAYIFRTADTDLHLSPKILSIKVIETQILSEVHAKFRLDEKSTIKQITRLIKGKDYVEVEYVVDPVPIKDGIGKEIISRYSTNIKSDGLFFTDSNGREFVERRRGDNKLYGSIEQDPVSIEPIAANYYPVNAAIFVEDNYTSFSVLVDRSQGGSSLSDGSVELMIQRRLLHDDARGCAEPLNETDIGITPNQPYGNATRIGEGIVVKGVHRIMIGQGMSGAAKARSRMDEIFSQPHVFVSSANRDDDFHLQFQTARLSAIESSLPKNVMLITYALTEDGTYLIRLGHQYGPNESNELSVPVEVDMSALFPSKAITNFTEKTLSGNQNRIEWESKRLRWRTGKLKESTYTEAYSRILQEGTTVLLQPLEIRTFEVEVA